MILATVSILAMSLSACNSSDVYNTYKAAQEKNNKLTSSDMNVNIKLGMKMADQSMDIVEAGSVKLKKADGKIQALEDLTATVAGQTQQIKVFSDGNKFYTQTNVGGSDVLVDLEYDQKTMQDNLKQFDLASFTKDMTKTIKSTSGNAKDVSITLDGKKFSSTLKDLIANYSSSLGDASALDAMKFDFSDVTLALTIDKNGYISKQNMKFSVNIDASALASSSSGSSSSSDAATKMTMTMEATITLNNPGKTVDFTLPDTSKAVSLTDFLSQTNAAG